MHGADTGRECVVRFELSAFVATAALRSKLEVASSPSRQRCSLHTAHNQAGACAHVVWSTECVFI